MSLILPLNSFWELFKKTEGAFSTAEAIALINICLDVPHGTYLELGTHKGKSALAASYSMDGGEFFLDDLIFEDNQIRNTVLEKLSTYNPAVKFNAIAKLSTEVIPFFDNLSYCFVDTGDHSEELVSSEVLLLEDRIAPNGIIAFHDLDNQFVAVRKWYDYLVSTNKYEPIVIDWVSIFNYVRENNLEEGNNSWHEKGSEEFPKFVGALKRKI